MAERINDGGPAFPVPGLQHDEAFNGMTLRDYFAAKAMQALVGADFRRDTAAEEDAIYAYKVADAMLRAREGGTA